MVKKGNPKHSSIEKDRSKPTGWFTPRLPALVFLFQGVRSEGKLTEIKKEFR
jgi:hypothetical protein